MLLSVENPIGIPLSYLTLLYSHFHDIDPIINQETGARGRMNDGDDASRESVDIACRIRDANQHCSYLDFLYSSCKFMFLVTFRSR